MAAPSRWQPALPWLLYALLLILAPLLWSSGFALTLLAQIGIAIILCQSYHLLHAEGGMLSFGHAVHSGLGAYAAIHVLRLMNAGELWMPVSLLPLAGGLAGLASAALFGLLATRKAGTAFAMITLGISELVWALALMLPEFSGGEGGLSADRVTGDPVLGISFGPAREVVWLIAAYVFGCSVALHALRRTPLGLMLNAVRDNPLRVGFLGASAPQVRWRVYMIAGLLAGISGGLAALQFEIVSAESLSAHRSGAVLLFAVLGGSGVRFGRSAGPVIGAVLMVLALVLLSAWTRAWLLYLGLLFIAVVMVAPQGLAGLMESAWARLRTPSARQRLWHLRAPLLALAVSGLGALTGLVLALEMLYRRLLDDDSLVQTALRLPGGLWLDAQQPLAWVWVLLPTLLLAALARWSRRWLWHQYQLTAEPCDERDESAGQKGAAA